MADLIECCCHCHEHCCEALDLLKGLDFDSEDFCTDDAKSVVAQVVTLLEDCCETCVAAYPKLAE